MGDSENAQQTSKKRGAVKELSRDNPGLDDEEDIALFESGTFKKASDEVLANRRIVKVKRKEPSAVPAAAAPNPFAGIQLVPASAAPAPTVVGTNPPLAEPKVTSAEAVVEENQKESDEEGDEVDSKKVNVKDSSEKETVKTKDEDDKTVSGVANISNAPEGIDSAKEETEKTKHEDDKQVSVADDKAVSGVTNISNAPEGTDETADPLERGSGGDQTERTEKEGGENKEGDNNGGLSSFQQHSSNKNAFTGLASTEASASPFSFSSISQDPSGSLFGFALPNTSIFGSSITNKTEANPFPPKQEVSTETGEENEKLAFSADSVLFEYLKGGWKERGKGEVKVNVSSKDGKARLVMRAKGNYRLILNASLYPEMKLTSMDKKGITFACVNSIISEEEEGKKVGLSTFALKFKDPLIVGEFRVAIDKHKALLPLETPENSPTDA